MRECGDDAARPAVRNDLEKMLRAEVVDDGLKAGVEKRERALMFERSSPGWCSFLLKLRVSSGSGKKKGKARPVQKKDECCVSFVEWLDDRGQRGSI